MILLPAQLEGVSTRKDKTIKLVFGSQELNPNDAASVMTLANSFCFLAIKPETFTETEKELMAQVKADMLTNNAKHLAPLFISGMIALGGYMTTINSKDNGNTGN